MRIPDTKTKKVALTGMLIATAFILNYLETLLPAFIPVPGIKIGLANIVVLFALYALGPVYGIGLSVVRVVLAGFTFGSLFTILYSLAGCALSFIVMLLLKKVKGFSIIGVSVAGGVAHNAGQVIVAIILLGSSIFYYAPALIISGIVAGVLTGTAAKLVLGNK